MFVIVGLGNPGGRYAHTRHNVGRDVLVRALADMDMGEPVSSKKYAGRIKEGTLDGADVLFLFPETFMNNSGSSVKKAMAEAGKDAQLIVVYDDVDLPVGEIKVSYGRGAGGHNGISSIIDALGSKEFARIRIGIAPRSFWSGKTQRPHSGAPMTRHVLGKFTKREAKKLEAVVLQVRDAIRTIIESGVQQAMNTYN